MLSIAETKTFLNPRKGKTLAQIYGEDRARLMRSKMPRFPKGGTPHNKLPREVRICLCGCNVEFECTIKSTKKFISGHNRRGKILVPREVRVCACGCGFNKEVLKNSRWKYKAGHSSKTLENRKIMSDRSILRTSNKSPNWKGGTTPISVSIRSLQESTNWKNFVLSRDVFTCQDCKKVGGDLEAHHIVRFSFIMKDFLNMYNQFSPIEDKETLVRLSTSYTKFWDVSNGVTLCLRCHDKISSKPSKLEILNHTKGGL